MPKIVRRIVNHKYLPIKPETLQKNTVVPFDCFIKRFDDFLIIIEAGTYIYQELHDKIMQNPSVYILKHDTVKLQEYYSAHSQPAVFDHGDSENEEMAIIADLKTINESLSRAALYEDRLQIIYGTISGLMQTIFDQRKETLPLEALQTCAEYMVGCIIAENKSVPTMLKIMPEEYTLHNHSTNVAIFSAMVGKAAGFSKEDLVDLVFAALLHDIGKIRIDQQILCKPGHLDEDEYRIMRHHPDYGWEILQKNGIDKLSILHGVRYHHEKLDGSGYPEQRTGKIIPKSAKIIGLCDVFDALTTKRTFRPSYTSFEALMMMKRDMNRQFDESYTDALIRLLR